MDNTKEIIALGEEARIFKNSRLWGYIISRSEHEVDLAVKELFTTSPEDSVRIAMIQNKVTKYSDFSNWLDELVLASDAAYEEYLNAEE